MIRVVSAEIHGSRVVEGINGMFGKFILTPVWAISMTSCFVYRDRFRQPRGMERAV